MSTKSIRAMSFEKTLIEYFTILDESLDKISHQQEGKLIRLPSWVQVNRKIDIGLTTDHEGIVLRISPDSALETDQFAVHQINNTDDINRIISPMAFKGNLPNQEPDENSFVMIGDISVVNVDNPLAVPALDNQCLIGWGRKKGFFDAFNIEKAKSEAIDLWNKSNFIREKKIGNYIQEVKRVFSKFRSIIKRKAFLERRIHRYINAYPKILLPAHKRLLFDHKLYRSDDERKADFILEREQGLPAILIELESPVHQILTKKLDLTAQANHARVQISEWVSFIENDPARNASNENYFLTGPKERLVIIGRGLEHRDRLIETKFDGVVFWTYDIFIEEAINRLNDQYALQCQTVGLEIKKPF